MWWYSDPSMYITQSVIQKEFEKEGFRCDPLNYDEFYGSALGYDECLLKVRAPTIDTVVLTGDEYSFIPFDPRLVRQRDGKGVDKSIYNPVGGGTSKKAIADMEAQMQADMLAAYADFAGFDESSFDPNDPYASFGANFDPDTGSYSDPGGFGEFSDPGGGGGFSDAGGAGGFSDPGGAGGSYDSSPASDLVSDDSSPVPDPVPDEGAAMPADDGTGGMDEMPGMGKRRLLQDDVDVEYEGLAELSGCNCNMIVTYTEDDDEEYKEKNKELRFYSDTTDSSCYPDDGASGDACTMTKAKAVLMYRQFLSVNDPCEFVKRSSPFQCVREEAAPLTQRLSLAYANSGLLYGIVCAMAVNYMYATKKVTLETVDIEQLQKMASMNKVSAEEEPAK